MRSPIRIRLAAAALMLAPLAGGCNRSADVVLSKFAQEVDLAPLEGVAVQHNGRLKSFDSYAHAMMKFVSGPREILGQSDTFSYLDLLFRSEAYQDADIIYVKHKDVRRRIAQTLASDPALAGDRLRRFQETGLISQKLLGRPEVGVLLEEMAGDLIRTSKQVDAIQSAVAVSDPRTLSSNLLFIPPAGDDQMAAWFSIDALARSGAGAPQDSVHAGLAAPAAIPGLDAGLQERLAAAWRELAEGWKRQDAPAASAALVKISELLRSLNPGLYPPLDKLHLESTYFQWKGMVWTWMIYLLAIVPLLMAVVYHWPWARRLGLLVCVIAFGLHTSSLGIRWYLGGRIPNSNMFEAILAATWFGTLGAFVIEFLVRKTAMKNLFALGAAVCSMVAMMCSHFMPATLSPDIDHVMPVLNDVWLYIHTNVIIFSYCLIGMAAVTALLYLGYRLIGGSSEYAKAGGAGHLILAKAPGNPAGRFLRTGSSMGQVLDGATMILMELSFVLLWAGLVMGAIWADHSWGRPWGWDPKEVFALNTFIIFLILVHVRLKVRDKGWWTAVLACVGCGVMLFNWIVVNFVITGLHSYA